MIFVLRTKTTIHPSVSRKQKTVSYCYIAFVAAPLRKVFPVGVATESFGRKMAEHENYPANRKVVSRDNWRNSFMKMRIDGGVKTASVKKDFDRQSAKLQENGVIHAYNDMVWFVHEEDRQDI